MSVLAPLLSQRGLDPNLLLAMNNNGFGGNNSGWFFWILLFLLFGWGRNGFGGCNGNDNGAALAGDAYLSNMLNNDTGRELLMQAIQGNGSRIAELAQMFNCSTQTMQNAICQLQSAINNVGSQVGMSSLQTINAIQSGNASVASQLAQCCCDNQLAICQQTNTLQQAINSVNVGQERGFSQIGFLTQQQTCDVRDAIRENTAQVLEGQRSAEMRELQREIAERDRIISDQKTTIVNGQQTAMFGQMIQQATTPIVNAVAALQGDINGIKCRLPETVTLPANNSIAVPITGYPFGALVGATALAGLNSCGCYNNSLWG